MFERSVSERQSESFASVEAAWKYARRVQRSRRRYEAFLKHLKALGITGRYLDVGAGTGTPAVTVAEDHPEVEITALELSPAMIQVGKEYVRSRGLQDRIIFVLGDATDEGTIEALGEFDIIYSTFSLHHWEAPAVVIRNLLNSLRGSGVLYLYDLRRVWWLYCIPVHKGFFASIRGAYVAGEIRELLGGLGVVSYEVKNEPPFLLSVIIRKAG
ncbi:MAG: class I SAM-dependent methyltransferase [Actinobacteria bacterium]|jgi:SAM-dependent methyltransferase|nr:class I SAM-dependent methyltransferase [Actinomycetota bacterium]